jgi:hypothetical protein
MRTDGSPVVALVAHARRHAIACCALVCSVLALGGASYAALQLPPESVGSAQLKNHAITPVKFAQSAIGGVVRHWAVVTATARVLDSSNPAHAQRGGNTITVDWKDKFSGRCIALATIRGNGDVAIGSVEATVLHGGSSPSRVAVTGSTNDGKPVAQPFYVAVIC